MRSQWLRPQAHLQLRRAGLAGTHPGGSPRAQEPAHCPAPRPTKTRRGRGADARGVWGEPLARRPASRDPAPLRTALARSRLGERGSRSPQGG
eukprot:7984552-Alexandrium_andersonii.AAC.1